MDLHELIRTPGAVLPFRQELDTARLDFPSVLEYVSVPAGSGVIRNEAGALMLTGPLTAAFRCRCDRCAKEFGRSLSLDLEVPLAQDLLDEEDPDQYPVHGGELDLEDLLETEFIFGMDTRQLCREDCKGLCPRCGADLNDGPCGCVPEKDPRLAVLEQLLDDMKE